MGSMNTDNFPIILIVSLYSTALRNSEKDKTIFANVIRSKKSNARGYPDQMGSYITEL